MTGSDIAGNGGRSMIPSAPHRSSRGNLLLAASTLALAIAMQPAVAQVQPGDPQCPTSGTNVTCSGVLLPGVEITPEYAFDRLTITGVAGDIMPAAGVSGIDFRNESNTQRGNIFIDNSQGGYRIITTGRAAHGISVQNTDPFTNVDPFFFGGDVTVLNNADISTASDGTTDLRTESNGIDLFLGGDGVHRIENNGDIQISGQGNGIDYRHAGGNFELIFRNNGTITTSYPGMPERAGVPIRIRYSAINFGPGRIGGSSKIDFVNNGTINSGEDVLAAISIANSSGIFDTALPVLMPVQTGFDFLNTGDINSAGSGISILLGAAEEAFRQRSTQAMTIENRGTIRHTGTGIDIAIRNSRDTLAEQGFLTVRNSGDIIGGFTGLVAGSNFDALIANSGRIEASRRGLIAVSIEGDREATIDVRNTGTILVTDNDATGLWLVDLNRQPGENDRIVAIQNGDITAEGTDSNAIKLTSLVSFGSAGDVLDGDKILVIGSGNIRGGSGDGAGILIDGGRTNTITNRGTVSALSGIAIRGGDSADIIRNETGGRLIGLVVLGAGDDTLLHMAGSRTEGNIDLGDGADRLDYDAANSVITGNIDGSAGNDTFNLTGGVFALTGLANFELANILTGAIGLGTGTFGGSINVGDGGVLAPGSSIGTLNVMGDVVFGDGSVFRVEVDADGNSDRLAATGAVEISGTDTILDVIGAPGDYPDMLTYTIINADDGVTGQFETIRDNLPDIDLTAVYDTKNVQLAYTKATAVMSQKDIHPATTAAGLSAGRTFTETLRRRGGLYAGRNTGTSNQNARALGFLASGDEQTAVFRRTVAVVGNTVVTQPPWGTWGAVTGDLAKTDAFGAAPAWEASSGGLITGFERRFEAFDMPFVVGVAANYSRSQIDAGASNAELTSWQLGVYAASQVGPLTVSGALGYGFQQYDLTRLVPFVGGTAVATGMADGGVFTASGEAFYDLAPLPGMPLAHWGPIATVDLVNGHRDAFTETGAGVLNLAVARDAATQVTTGVGLAFETEHAIGETELTLNGRIAWEHVFGDRSVTTTTSIPLAGATFLTASAPVNADRLAVGLGATLEFTDRVSGHLRYDGAFSGSFDSHRGSAGLTIRF